MSASSFDCYLCGTANPSDSNHCVKCGGQLLKIADAEKQDDLPSTFENPFEVNDSSAQLPTEPAPAPKKPTRKVHASIEDQRLSDALGLSEKPEKPAPRNTQTSDAQTQSAPQASNENPTPQRPSAGGPADQSNPLPDRAPQPSRPIGRSPQGGVFSARGDEKVGPVAWVIVAMLFLAVGWLGYFTLFRTTERPSPESIGFVADTTTVPPTTTIPEADGLLTLREVNSAYDDALVRVIPFACAAGLGEQNGEPIVGVAINERSVLIGPDLPAGTNAIRVATRSGATRVAILSQENGVTIATSLARTNRNLEIEDFGDEAAFFVAYDLDSNEVSTAETSQGANVEIEVSETGAVHGVRSGDASLSVEQLAAIDISVERQEDAVAGGTTCAEAGSLIFSSPEASTDEDAE